MSTQALLPGFSFDIDSREFDREMGSFARQIPFMTSYAMNLTGKQSVIQVRQDIHRIFTIRNKWEELGVTFKPASKSRLVLEVGSRHEYMAAQVLGGKKKAKGGGSVAVPMVGRGLPRTSIKAKTPPKKHPKAIVGGSRGAFVGTVQTKKGPVRGVWRRVPRNLKSGKVARKSSKRTRPGLVLLYQLEKSVNIDARWPLEKQVVSVWNAKWEDNIVDALEYAIRTAKKK